MNVISAIPHKTLLLATAVAIAACAPTHTAPANPAVAVTAAATAPQALTAALDSIMAAAYPADQPGAAAIVVQDGEVLLRQGYGMADLELDVPMRPEYVFRIGSMTKQFTGAAILMLKQEGRLSLEDPLTRFLPDYPTDGRTVTVEQLLGHSSGIRSYTNMPEWNETIREDVSLEELIATFRDEPFDFEPGEDYSYNNSGYVLLGAIIEEVSGMSYEDFLRTRIFERLGMESSGYGNAARITTNRIPGYSRQEDEWVNAEYFSMTQAHAAGALLSSVDDMARWDAAITRGALLGESGWERAHTPIRLNDGRSTRYGAGWGLGRIGHYETIEHGGGIDGFTVHALRVPDANLFVAVLTNADSPVTPPVQFALRLADKVLGGVMDDPEEVPVDLERLEEYAGDFQFDDGYTFTISVEETTLHWSVGEQRGELRPIGQDLFFDPDSGFRFRFDREAGRVVAVVLEPRVGMPERASRIDEEARVDP